MSSTARSTSKIGYEPYPQVEALTACDVTGPGADRREPTPRARSGTYPGRVSVGWALTIGVVGSISSVKPGDSCTSTYLNVFGSTRGEVSPTIHHSYRSIVPPGIQLL